MTNGSDRPSKKDRQNAAREKARLMREAEQKKKRRNRAFLQGGIGLGIVVVIAVIAIVVVQVAKPTSTAGPKNMLSDGIVLTGTTSYVSTAAIPNGGKPTATKQADDGKAHVTIYEDLQCPVCQAFEEASDTNISTWLDAGTATLEIHPISLPNLDASSNGNHYSRRAASAMACVAQYSPKDFFAVNKAFYDDQPEENSNGATDAQIIAKIKKGGASSSEISSCVKDKTFVGWVQKASDRALNGSKLPNSSLKQVTGTPTILVNGKSYTPPSSSTLGYGDADAFTAFVKTIVPKIEG